MGEYWIPIEELPISLKGTRKMFVVIAKDIEGFASSPYTSDPYCVWEVNGDFVRWPHHKFKPTHFCHLPSAFN